MTTTYAQVARTYAENRVIVYSLGFAFMGFAVSALCVPVPGYRMLLAVAPWLIGLSIAQLAKVQFANPRSRLLPGFAGPHLAGLAVLALLGCGTVWFAMVHSQIASPLNAAAIILPLFALAAWAAYLPPWLLFFVFLAWLVSILAWDLSAINPLMHGSHSILAWASLACSALILWRLALRLTQLSEEQPGYAAELASAFHEPLKPSLGFTMQQRWARAPSWPDQIFLSLAAKRMDRALGPAQK